MRFPISALALGGLILPLALGCGSKSNSESAAPSLAPTRVPSTELPVATLPEAKVPETKPSVTVQPTPAPIAVGFKEPEQPVVETKPLEVAQANLQVPAPKPPEPAEPAKPETQKPETEPKKAVYPERVGGKSLDEWLKELRYSGGIGLGGGSPVQKDAFIREQALKNIPSFGPEGRAKVVGPLIDVIREDPDPSVQVAAITVISNVGFDMRKQTAPVIAVLQNQFQLSASGSIVKMYCVRSIASFGPDAVGTIPSLKNHGCLDKSWETRKEVAIALGSIGCVPLEADGKPKKDTGPNENAIQTLMDYQLKDPCLAVRLEGVKSLLILGPPYVKDLKDFALRTEKYSKIIGDQLAFESGKKVSSRGATPDKLMHIWLLLLQIMYDDRTTKTNLDEIAKYIKAPDNPEQRLYALQALGVIGPLAAPMVPKIVDALGYAEPELVLTAMAALAAIGNEARDAIPKLEEIKKKPPTIPIDAPKGYIPDDTLQRNAEETIKIITGKKKMDGKKDDKKDDLKAPPPDKKK